MSTTPLKIVMLGGTGAVGTEVIKTLVQLPQLERLTLLGRRPVEGFDHPAIEQHRIDIFTPDGYAPQLAGHNVAICTLGIGEPSKASREQFRKVDHDAVLDFGKLCKSAGVKHFELLSSVGQRASSANWYLRVKGELVVGLEQLQFQRLSIFQPSMILTPTNRYGFSQGIMLKIWPWLHPLLVGSLKQYRGIKVAELGEAIARHALVSDTGNEYLTWTDFQALIEQ